MLAGRQHLDHLLEPRLAGTLFFQASQEQAQLAVEGIDLANGLDSWMVLGDAAAVPRPVSPLSPVRV